MTKTLFFKWTISRGRDTYGYNICTLWIEGQRVAACNGGGYDMMGTVLGMYIQSRFQEELKNLDVKKFDGLTEYKGKMICDGGCGFSSMEYILKALGYNLQYHKTRGQNSLYSLHKIEESTLVGQ